MRIRRKLPVLFGFLLFAAAIALAVVLRKHAPPEPARLLPGADGYFYANLKWIRRANIAGQMPDVPHEPEYEQFIQATGLSVRTRSGPGGLRHPLSAGQTRG